jgi:hypothetical protein
MLLKSLPICPVGFVLKSLIPFQAFIRFLDSIGSMLHSIYGYLPGGVSPIRNKPSFQWFVLLSIWQKYITQNVK